jgi:CRISPR-associated protein Cas1
MTTESEETIPIRMCNELVYCPRLFHIEHVQGIFVESAETVEGSGQHERAARRGKVRRKPGTVAATDDPDQPATDVAPWDALIPRSMEWSAPGWGVHGRLDMIELGADEVVAVEAKRGSAPTTDQHRWQDFELPHRAWPPDVAQLGLYMAALRDAGLPCSEGRLFYRGNGIHTIIAWSDELERFLRAVVAEALRVRSLPVAPDPLESSPKCVGCSLHGVCLPDEHHALKAEAAARELHPIRRIIPGRDDRAVVHVTRPGTLVRKEGESLVICPRDQEPERLLLKDISHVALYGPVQVTEQCMQLLLMQGVPVSHHTSAGRLLGLSAPMLSQNIHLRRAQFRAADDPARCLEAARALVVAKVRNQRTVLRRYGRGVEQTLCDEQGDLPDWADTDCDAALPAPGTDDSGPTTSPRPPAEAHDNDDDDNDDDNGNDETSADDPALPELALARGQPPEDPRIRCTRALRAMQQALRRAGLAGDLDVLRGCEGEAAACYFAALPAILPAAWQQDFVGRSRRPPRDRVNALLSFGYALLTRDATAAAARVGLDPMLGFLHTVVPGRPALALDLMEPFRAAWVDTAILRLLATRGIDREDFVFTSAGVSLTDRGRNALIGAYERRAEELTTHPRFGYRMAYRRLLELEARVLGKWLVGEVEHYTPIWTR